VQARRPDRFQPPRGSTIKGAVRQFQEYRDEAVEITRNLRGNVTKVTTAFRFGKGERERKNLSVA
jgi:CRISPR/Cas system CMR subunit Cmr4 (Cas7 group RAMP superfamily)